MRFFGLSYSELDDMDIETFYGLCDSARILEAQEYLSMLTAQDWPNMSKASRQKLHKDLTKQAQVSKESKAASLKDIARILSGR